MRDSGPDIDIHDRPLPYVDNLGARAMGDVDLVIMHCTELPTLADAREYGERILYPQSGSGNSGHFYIDRDGRIERWVPEDRIAHHVRGMNTHSIGIELVNTGRYPEWFDSRRQAMDESYTLRQVDALLALLQDLQARLPALVRIAGHEDLDVEEVAADDDPAVMIRRKLDPGPKFPWARVLAGCRLERLVP